MRNAYSGYTYQKHVTELLLSKMDVERSIDKIEIEADVNNKFDDAKVSFGDVEYYFQIKDFEGISLDDLVLSDGNIKIHGNNHKLSDAKNILFFKSIPLTPNCEILGFPAFKMSDIYVVSFNRSQIDKKIDEFYKNDILRKQEIENWFHECLDKREWILLREDLPSIKVFNTELQEKTIDTGRKHLQIHNLLLIEGKPGVGKSHFVNSLTKEYNKSILYRFWISSQDEDYEKRLKFKNFIFDFSKKLFNDQKFRDINEIFEEIKKRKKTVIIDGLDHIENYNLPEFELFIDFINKLKNYCKVIVLSRPLQKKLEWEKFNLINWNEKQTQKVLDELFHISDYQIFKKIYSITEGYPILVKYIAEHYKLYKAIPNLNKLESVDSYYNNLIKQEKGKQLLSLFLCNRSFFMKSEIIQILDEAANYVNEFIEEHPYLFEIRLNRISLFHDSFNTFLRKQKIDYSSISEKVNLYVYNSIQSLDKRFLSRFNYFYLNNQYKKDIVLKYCQISTFRELIQNVIDFEAIQSFYFQIREAINALNYEDLEITHYYDLSLILNVVSRDHISTLNAFYYTYTKALLNNGFSEENITSTRYLFAMLCYIKSNDSTLLFNITSDDMYSTERFSENLQDEIDTEDYYFDQHEKALTEERLEELLQDKLNLKDIVTYSLESSFIHGNTTGSFSVLHECIQLYMSGKENIAINKLASFLKPYSSQEYYSNWTLKDAKRNILAYGYLPEINDYKKLSLRDFILARKDLGSFELRDEIHNYIRLSLQESRKIDISNISLYWTKYYQRKDYSFINLDTALYEFERKRYVSMFECIELIHKIQEISEKGYRGLLSGFVELYPPHEILPFILKNFDIENLRIEWFHLPVEYINIFPDQIFNFALREILRYHNYNKVVDLNDIVNVLYSNRLSELVQILEITKYSIRVPKSHSIIKEFKNSDLSFVQFEPDKYEYEDDSQSRFNRGELTIKDKEFILNNNIKSYEVAGFSNGYHSALADTELFKIYTKNDVKDNFKQILYNALLGKAKSINFFHDVYNYPGNVLKMVREYEIDVDYDVLFKDFLNYLDISQFGLKN